MKKIVIIALVICGLYIIGGSNEDKKEDAVATTAQVAANSSTVSSETVVPERVIVENTDISETEKQKETTLGEEKTSEETSTVIADNASKDEAQLPVNETTGVVENTTVSEEGNENPFLYIKDLSLKVRTDYGHLETSYIRLGNYETATITVEATPAEVTIDDIYFYYDENALSLEILEEYSEDDTKYIKLSLAGNVEGLHDFVVCPMWDLLERKEEDIRGVSYQVQKLNSYEGQLVFITPTGKKYHCSEACAGVNGSATTRYDAEGCPYEPCGKCS